MGNYTQKWENRTFAAIFRMIWTMETRNLPVQSVDQNHHLFQTLWLFLQKKKGRQKFQCGKTGQVESSGLDSFMLWCGKETRSKVFFWKWVWQGTSKVCMVTESPNPNSSLRLCFVVWFRKGHLEPMVETCGFWAWGSGDTERVASTRRTSVVCAWSIVAPCYFYCCDCTKCGALTHCKRHGLFWEMQKRNATRTRFGYGQGISPVRNKVQIKRRRLQALESQQGSRIIFLVWALESDPESVPVITGLKLPPHPEITPPPPRIMCCENPSISSIGEL